MLFRSAEDCKASTEGPKHHQLVSNQYKGGGSTVKGIQRVWFGGGRKRDLYLVSSCESMTSFGNIPYWDGILSKRGSRWLGPFDACH